MKKEILAMLFFIPHPSALIPAVRGRNALSGQNATARDNRICTNAQLMPGMWIARPPCGLKCLRVARQCLARKPGGKEFCEKQPMYFALLIVIALIVAALVLFLEHRAEMRLLEREDGSRATVSKKTSLK